jgi:hypothetical protein
MPVRAATGLLLATVLWAGQSDAQTRTKPPGAKPPPTPAPYDAEMEGQAMVRSSPAGSAGPSRAAIARYRARNKKFAEYQTRLLMNRYVKASNARDSTTLFPMLAEGVTLFTTRGAINGREAVIQTVREQMDSRAQLSITPLYSDGNALGVHQTGRLTMSDAGGTRRGVYIFAFTEENGAWKISSMHLVNAAAP